MEFMQGQNIGSYIIEDEIKRGGMAWILKVLSLQNEPYAMKLSLVGLSNEQNEHNRNAIRGEADLLSRLNHQRVVRVVPIPRDKNDFRSGNRYYASIYRMEGQPWYFIMEYLEGDNLNDHIKKYGPLTVAEASNIIGNVCLGLNYLYSRNLTHNDLKAENVVFRKPIRKGELFDPVLIDFGTAAGVKSYREEAGTFYTMPPERIRVARGLDSPEFYIDPVSAEIWSIGVLLYQSLTGKVPFPSNNPRRLTSQILDVKATSIRNFNSEVDPGFDRFVVDGCLSKTPNSRPSIQEVLTFLSPYGSGPVVASKAKSL
ncbi:MAG: serine/threonine-protein kinase [Chloroflexota bacterium]